MNDNASHAVPAAATASPTPSPATDRLIAALSAALSREDASWSQKLSLLNRTLQATDAAAGCQAICAAISDTLQFYPQIVAEAADDLSGEDAESVALLHSCPSCLFSYLSHLASGSCSCPAALSAPLLLHVLSWLLGLSLSPHALVSEVGRATFGLAFRGLDESFARCATQMMMGALSGSVESLAAADSLSSSGGIDAAAAEFGLNVAQARILEILAPNAHVMPRDTQIYLFRHFNLSLTPAAALPSTAAAAGSAALSLSALCAPPTGVLPLSFLSALLLGCKIESMDPGIVAVLYRHTFSDCLTELSEFLSKPWANQCEALPLASFLVEMLTAACRAAPPVTAGSAVDAAFLQVFTGQAAALLFRLVESLCGVMHSHVASGKISASLGSALVVSTVRALHTPLVFPRVQPAAWTKLFSALHRVQAVVGASFGEQMLREAVLAVAQCAVPPADQQRFFNDVLRPAFHAILQPKNANAAAPSATGAASTAAASSSDASAPPASQSSTGSSASSVDESDEAGFDCFFRFSCQASECWSRRLKDLIPASGSVRARLISYVQSRSKRAKPLQMGFNGRSERVQRFGMDAPTNQDALSTDQLRAESARLKLQAALETEELKTHPANSHVQQRIAAIKQQQAPVMLAAWTEADYMLNDA